MANIKSQLKRIKTNERDRQYNQSIKSALKTGVKKVRNAVAENNAQAASDLLKEVNRKFDIATSKGVIHKNQAANRKSALAKSVNLINK